MYQDKDLGKVRDLQTSRDIIHVLFDILKMGALNPILIVFGNKAGKSQTNQKLTNTYYVSYSFVDIKIVRNWILITNISLLFWLVAVQVWKGPKTWKKLKVGFVCNTAVVRNSILICIYYSDQTINYYQMSYSAVMLRWGSCFCK